MPDVSYIDTDEDRGHASRNALFAELDRKLALALDNRSPLVLGSAALSRDLTGEVEIGDLLGNLFFFVQGDIPSRVFTAKFNPRVYDHAPFTNAASAAAVLSQDDSLRIARVGQPDTSYFTAAGLNPDADRFFSHSLEAHTKILTPPGPPPAEGSGPTVRYYLQEEWKLPAFTEPVCPVAEKRYRYAVAELVYEGPNFQSVQIPSSWNKYNCFRIHNLNAYPMSVVFEGTNGFGQATIPAYGCKAVRRDSVASGYDASLNYFWVFRTGDPRFWSYRARTGQPTPGHEAALSMEANNIMNQSILFQWIQAFAHGLDGVRFHRDPHLVWGAGGFYRDIFCDPHDTSNIIGDALHHKGKLLVISRTSEPKPTVVEVEFKGYRTIVGDLAGGGVRVTRSGNDLLLEDVAREIGTDLAAVGTNLLNRNGDMHPVVDIYNAQWQIDRHVPAPTITGVTGNPSEVVWGYYEVSEEGVRGDFVRLTPDEINLTIAPLDNSGAPELVIHEQTIAQALQLNWCGVASLEQEFVAYVNGRMELTLFGPQILVETHIKLDHAIGVFAELQGWSITPEIGSIGAGELVLKETITFDGYGWPTVENPSLLSPRFTRKYSARPAGHPDVINDPVAADGGDFDVQSVGQDYRDTTIRTIAPIAQVRSTPEPWGFTIPVWPNPDVLYELLLNYQTEDWYEENRDRLLDNSPGEGTGPTYMPFQLLLRELFNTAAAWVNSITRIMPFSWRNWPDYIAPNSLGIHGTTIRPLSHYATIERDSEAWRICGRLGIPIKSKDDLPASYAAVLEVDRNPKFITARFTHKIKTATFRETFLGGTVAEFDDLYDVSVEVIPTEFKVEEMPAPGSIVNGVVIDNSEIIAAGGKLVDPSTFAGVDGMGPTQPMEDFFWITIADVQAAAARLGLKFLHQAGAVPLELKSWTVGFQQLFDHTEPLFEMAWHRLRGKYDHSPDDPDPNELVIDSYIAGQFNKTAVAAFIVAEDADWKADAPASDWRLSAGGPGDISTGLIPGANPLPFQVLTDGEYRAALAGVTIQGIFPRIPFALFQVYYSAGFENGSVAALIPCAWPDHPDAGFSQSAYGRAVLRRLAEAGQANVAPGDLLPITAKEPEGTVSLEPLTEGETFIACPPGEARQIIVNWNDLIAV